MWSPFAAFSVQHVVHFHALYLPVFAVLHLPSHLPFPFIKFVEWPSEAVCAVWYVRNSAEQTRKGRREEEEDEGRLLFQTSWPKQPQKTWREKRKMQLRTDCVGDKKHFSVVRDKQIHNLNDNNGADRQLKSTMSVYGHLTCASLKSFMTSSK